MIVGITGTIGSGKDTTGEYLVKEKKFIHHSLSDIIRLETDKRGLEQSRDNWVIVGNEIREKFGNGELARRLLNLIKENQEANTVITSVRTPGEIEIFKNSDMSFHLISVDAPVEMRFERIKNRGNLADQVDFEKFKEQEESEMANTGSGQQIGTCMAMADETIINEGTFDELNDKIENLLKKLNEN